MLSTLILTASLVLVAQGDHAPHRQDRATAAIALLERSAEAMGGLQRIRQLEGAAYSYAGPTPSAGQGPTPDQPVVVRLTESLSVDLSERRLQTGYEAVWPDTQFAVNRVIELEGTDPWRPHFRSLRRSPHLLLHFALQQKADARLLDAERGIVAVNLLGRTLDLYIDPRTHQVRMSSFPYEHLRYGDARVDTEFLDYQDVDGWPVPGRIRQTEAGQLTLDTPFASYLLGSGISVEAAADEPAEQPAVQPPESAAVNLSDHAVLFTGIQQQNYNALVARTDQGLVVVEAPLSADAGRSLRRRIAAHFGDGAAVAAIVPTHHHGDHSGGLPGLADPDTHIVAVSRNHAFFRDMLTARRSLLAWPHQPFEPRFTLPTEARFTIDGADALRIIDIGPSGHADNHLVVLIEDNQTLLFQGDMVVFNVDGSVEPARDQGCVLQSAMEQLDLKPDLIIGAHGRSGTTADLDEAIAKRENPCPQPNPPSSAPSPSLR